MVISSFLSHLCAFLNFINTTPYTISCLVVSANDDVPCSLYLGKTINYGFDNAIPTNWSTTALAKNRGILLWRSGQSVIQEPGAGKEQVKVKVVLSASSEFNTHHKDCHIHITLFDFLVVTQHPRIQRTMAI